MLCPESANSNQGSKAGSSWDRKQDQLNQAKIKPGTSQSQQEINSRSIQDQTKIKTRTMRGSKWGQPRINPRST